MITKPFPVPNGSEVDLTQEMTAILNTVVTASGPFSPTDPATTESPDSCNTRLEIRSAVSTLEMNLTEYGLTIGWKPDGAVSVPITQITGEANVRIGTLAMDFSVWKCNGTRCSSVAASTAYANVKDSDASFQLNFGLISTGAGMVSHPSFTNLLRKIMTDGISKIAASPRLAELGWSARVREYDPNAGTVIFDAGLQSRIAPNESFVVYAVTPTSGACDVYKSVAYLKTVRVDAVSSLAVVEQVLDPRPITEGDLVMIAVKK